MAPHLANGTVETAHDDWYPSYPGFYLYYPSRREVTPALRAFIETMKRNGWSGTASLQWKPGRAWRATRARDQRGHSQAAGIF